MKKFRFIILGAGPSGLALAHTLLDRGVPLSEILVLEKESSAGGLCRSETVDGFPLDIGGGHFLDIKHKEVLEFIFRFMPESEWNRHDRISKIHLREQMVDHPLEANLWQFDIKTQVDYLEAIAQAGCIRGTPAPESFAAWIRWKFGDRIADDYMLPYNRKIWSMDPDLLGTYWLHKLPDVSFRETLHSCIEGKPYGSLPAHGVFLYPKIHGYGEVWRRMAESLGESIQLGVSIESFELASRTINGTWQADHVFSSVPWPAWLKWAALPEAVQSDIRALCNIAIDIDYIPESLEENAHWIYEPDEQLPHHRKLLRSNFSPGARGYWTETNSMRRSEATGWRHTNSYAYPVNTIDKPARIARIMEWAKTRKITGFGRWGTWDHMNSDIAVKQAIALGNAIVAS